MPAYLITGATSGLGLQVALRLSKQGGNRLILPVRNAARGEAIRRELGASAAQASTPVMDLSSLRSVSAFLKAFNRESGATLDGVLLNAGVQSANRMEFTPEGFETTFAVNHLAQHFLLEGLMGRLASQAFVGWTSSGTHDANLPFVKLFGFRGGQYKTARMLAEGKYPGAKSPAQACRDAYATSKLCNIVSARAFAERYPQEVNFFSFDPGLMPGTGLARKQGQAAQWIWRNVMPRLANMLPGTSTPTKSSAVLTDLLTGRLRASHNGAHLDFTGKQLEPSALATERWVGDDLMAGSDELLAPFAEAFPASFNPAPRLQARLSLRS